MRCEGGDERDTSFFGGIIEGGVYVALHGVGFWGGTDRVNKEDGGKEGELEEFWGGNIFRIYSTPLYLGQSKTQDFDLIRPRGCNERWSADALNELRSILNHHTYSKKHVFTCLHHQDY